MAIFDLYNINGDSHIELDLMSIPLQRNTSEPIKLDHLNNPYIEICLISEPFIEQLNKISLFQYDSLNPIVTVMDGQAYIHIGYTKDGENHTLEYGDIVKKDEYEKVAQFIRNSLSTTEYKEIDFYDSYEKCVKGNLEFILHNDHADLNNKTIDFLVEKIYPAFIAKHSDYFSLSDDILGDEVCTAINNILENLAEQALK